MMEFVDKKAQQVDSLRKWVLTAEGNLKNYVQEGDERVKELKHLLDETAQLSASAVAPRPGRPASREQERPAPAVSEETDVESRIVGLRQQNWSAQQIAKKLNMSIPEVLEILKRHSL